MGEPRKVPEDFPLPAERGAGTLVDRIQAELSQIAHRLNQGTCSLDMHFLAFLQATSSFGYFTFGPVTIDVRLIEEIVTRTTPPTPPGEPWTWRIAEDNARFADTIMKEVRKSGRRRLDELHYLLAFMRTNEGLPGRVFGELGVTPEEVERFARSQANPVVAEEKLYSPEEAADYLGVHVKTVRSWIRDGRLRASRLAGQRALRIRASDLQSLLEPVEPGEVD